MRDKESLADFIQGGPRRRELRCLVSQSECILQKSSVYAPDIDTCWHSTLCASQLLLVQQATHPLWTLQDRWQLSRYSEHDTCCGTNQSGHTASNLFLSKLSDQLWSQNRATESFSFEGEGYRSTSTSCQAYNAWSYMPTPSYAFLKWCLIGFSDKILSFKFLLILNLFI